ncbi:plasma membrane ThrE amino acid transmembrane transporter family protein [Schizosaccharomyces osmophilus]|uniref:Plasma membrane ThrE amino acid transmembrane transporter family protein n=1 Tax=Schizosaccharomyces osmophilus TaxID=2545709 RepID=A0AAE9WEJ2_9SCHI|nr:plasma membrane ThrE amino acid transmembrane transporter family protein [Schizosaccharomyces osmophilus]WBW74395.1 plasma membrane ThrE amino acid transmembrane transporter family protein [Schizosaccharomyces osmophilus]
MEGNRRVRFNTERRHFLNNSQAPYTNPTTYQRPPPSFSIEEGDEESDEDDGPQFLNVHRAPSPAVHRQTGSAGSTDNGNLNIPSLPSPVASRPVSDNNSIDERYASSIRTQDSPNQSLTNIAKRPTLDRSHSAPMIGMNNMENNSATDLTSTIPKVPSSVNEAYKLVAAHTSAKLEHMRLNAMKNTGENTDEENEKDPFEDELDILSHPKNYKAGVLSSLLKLYTNADTVTSSRISLKQPNASKLQKHSQLSSSHSLTDLMRASNQTFMGPAVGFQSRDDLSNLPKLPNQKSKKFHFPHHSKKPSSLNEKYKITVHLADVLQRQKYILKLCRALMTHGAPSHRLEEHMSSTAKVLEIEGQFLYVPGCMIISFGDTNTHTSDMHIVRVNQTVDLGKLKLVHDVYKAVVHDLMSVEEAINGLDTILKSPPYFKTWILVVTYGFASAFILPIAFSGGWIDLPISFFLGLIIGSLQLLIAPRSPLYNSLLEVTGSILTSFLSRAFGSIFHDRANKSNPIFCFAALAEGAIVLILPGYIVLCGSLELQSKNIVAGSVRMFYAIIYSLFLSFGIAIGAALYGWMDHHATSEYTCSVERYIDDKWRILFVPLFTVCLLIVNQARPSQWPVSLFISCVGYIVNYFTTQKHFKNTAAIGNAIAAFVIGCLGNLYSRLGQGVAFAAVLPAIFVQVPSGLAAQGGVKFGIDLATQISNNSNSTTSDDSSFNTSSLSFGINMVQIAIGISVGLFASALVIYPFGKRRSGLFSF